LEGLQAAAGAVEGLGPAAGAICEGCGAEMLEGQVWLKLNTGIRSVVVHRDYECLSEALGVEVFWGD
jgi:hypothetical protein